ncbi:MAG: hypothetical protein ACKV0T_27090 [Planctomycetales bacterium]
MMDWVPGETMVPKRSQTHQDMLHVAVLATDGVPVAEIARQLSFTLDKVYRLLRAADGAKLIQETRRFQFTDKSQASVKEQKFARRNLQERSRKLQQELRDCIPTGGADGFQEVHVFEAGRPGESVESRLYYRQRFCKTAGLVIRELLEQARIVVAAWGRLLRAVIEDQRCRGPLPTETARNLIVIPARGELSEGGQATELSPGRIAQDLAVVLTGSVSACRSFPGIPPFLPQIDEVDDPDHPEHRLAVLPALSAAVLREYVRRNQAFCEVFGDPATQSTAKRTLINRADLILTSLGTNDRFSIGPWNAQVLDASVRTQAERQRLRDEMAALAVGDFGGVMIPRAGCEERLEIWRQTWIGLTEDHLRDCVQRAAKPKRRNDRKPGVVVLAVAHESEDAARKAELVLHGLQRQIISRLLLDTQIADALVKILK